MTKTAPRGILSAVASLFCLSLALAGAERGPRIVRLSAEPSTLQLWGAGADHGLLVSAETDDGRLLDVTREAALSSSDPRVVQVADGRLKAVSDGEARILVAYADQTAAIPVFAVNTATPSAPSFRNEVVPVLTRYGCNQGGCHGKEAGQNGFKLSLRGFAPEEDYNRLIVESFGRRMNHASPDLSLVLAKASNRIPHRGGELFARDSRAYELLVRWIQAGTPNVLAAEAALSTLEILGGGRRMTPGQEQQLLVRGTFSDGRVQDLTWLAKFYSNDATVLGVSDTGRVKAKREGASTIRAHFQDKVAVVAFTIPHAAPVDPTLYEKRPSVVDGPVFDKLADLRIPPAPGAGDEEYLRRAYLDTIGTLPTAEEAA